jgi:hypothetical protein
MKLILKIVKLAFLALVAMVFSFKRIAHQELNPKYEDGKSKSVNKLTWKEYKIYIDLYKFYLNFGLKANVFFYAVTAAILTIIYSPVRLQEGQIKNLPPPVIEILLIIPFIISVVLAGAFFIGAILWAILACQIRKRVKKDEINVIAPPYLQLLTMLLLTVLLAAFGVIFVFATAFLCNIMRLNNVSFLWCRC